MPKVIIAPENGWEDNAYYHVEASFHDDDPIKGYVFSSCDLKKDKPTNGYFLNTEFNYNHAIYLRVITKLTTQKDVDNVPRRYKIVKDYYPF
jgi:hypothetical protein